MTNNYDIVPCPKCGFGLGFEPGEISTCKRIKVKCPNCRHKFIVQSASESKNQSQPVSEMSDDELEKKIIQACRMSKARNARKNFIEAIKQFWAETMELDWWEQRLKNK